MATLHGVSLKGMKTFRDHEGMNIAQANIYLGKKKIGFWSQDAWGGPDIVSLDYPFDERKLDQVIKDLGYDYTETFFWNLLCMKMDEDELKKSGCDRLFIGSDGYHLLMIEVEKDDTVDSVLHRPDVLRSIERSFFENGDYDFKIVDKDSFDVGEPIDINKIITHRTNH